MTRRLTTEIAGLDLDSLPAKVRLFPAPAHPCPYLPGKSAQLLVVDPSTPLDTGLYQRFLDQGFRRSGDYVYRPVCPNCNACVSLRLPVHQFTPNRNQRRCWVRGQREVRLVYRLPRRDSLHDTLYRRYQASRHGGGSVTGEGNGTPCLALAGSWCDTQFWELRLSEGLMAVAVVDALPKGFSAVYTFFDPELSDYSPGKLAVLWQIMEARKLGLPYVYLGYWVRNCRKMSYKTQYRPLEAWDGKTWHHFGHGEELITGLGR